MSATGTSSRLVLKKQPSTPRLPAGSLHWSQQRWPADSISPPVVPYVEVGLHGDPHLSPDCVGLGRRASLLLIWDLEMTLTHKMVFSRFPFICCGCIGRVWGRRREQNARHVLLQQKGPMTSPSPCPPALVALIQPLSNS